MEVGEQPIPRKLVITSKTMNAAPQYTIRIKSWKPANTLPADAFTFSPAAGMTKLTPEELSELDEIPPSAPVGETK